MKEYKNSLLNLICIKYPEKNRESLFTSILSGNVFVNSHRERNPKVLIKKNSLITLTPEKEKFVSRGGDKLLEAIEEFNIEVDRKICMDVGSSTGGFTDCLLRNGASKVYSVDVGKNQLVYELRVNNKVVVLENTNIFEIKEFDASLNFAVIDVSFRSAVKICSYLINKLFDKFIIVLIKPQFELMNLALKIDNFNGVVENNYLKPILIEVIKNFYNNKIQVEKIMKIKTKGRKGNQEFMFLVSPLSNLKVEDSLEILNRISFSS